MDKISNSQIIEKTIINMFLTVSWDVYRLLEDSEANVTEAAKKLRKKRTDLLKVIESVITNSAGGVFNAFLCLCDLLILFNWKLANDFTYPQIASLEITLNRDFNNKINNFLVDNVFVKETAEN
uniref:Uncharacterized protein n=1 Tax=Panagrolaimus sp. JU765 TaxID=591449 RepID=A0AC34RHB2_9BILA